MAAERGAFVSGPHTSSSPLQMLPEPMHYGWTRDPSNIEAGGEDKGSPSGAVRAPNLPGQPGGSGGYSRANTQFKGHKRPPPPLASRRAPSPALPAPAAARASPKRRAPWLWSWPPASGSAPARRQARSGREDLGAPRVQPAGGRGLSPYFPKPTAAGAGGTEGDWVRPPSSLS